MLRYTYLIEPRPFMLKFCKGYVDIIALMDFTIFEGPDLINTRIKIWPTTGTGCILTGRNDSAYGICVFSQSWTWEAKEEITISTHNSLGKNLPIYRGEIVAKLVPFMSTSMGVVDGVYINPDAF